MTSRRALLLHLAALAALTLAARPAAAQSVPFERTLTVPATAKLDAATFRGTIAVTTGAPGRIIVRGAATVRIGSVAADKALAIAKRLAAQPPVTQDGATVRVRPPSTEDDRRAVTVSYRVEVPPDTEVVAVSDSGAVTVTRVAGRVAVTTQSSTITLTELGGRAQVTSGSGAVQVDGVRGELDVTTSSSGIRAMRLGGALRVMTGSGAVRVGFTGTGGSADITTSSGAVDVTGLAGGLHVTTSSGRIVLAGRPIAAWSVTSGSGSIEATLDGGCELVAVTQSGSVTTTGVVGSVARQSVTGRIGNGGPRVELRNRSGSIRVTPRAAAG